MKSKKSTENKCQSLNENNDSIKELSSFEETDDPKLNEMLKLTPEERIRYTVELTLKAYGVTREELAKRPMNKKITFIKGTLLSGESFGD